MEISKWIVSNPEILGRKPIIKGTRISAAIILQCLTSGMDIDEILNAYPTLTREGVIAAIQFATYQMEGEEVIIGKA